MMDVINMNEMLLMDVKNKTADSPTNNSFKQLSFTRFACKWAPFVAERRIGNDFISVVFIYYFFYSKKSEFNSKNIFARLSSLFSTQALCALPVARRATGAQPRRGWVLVICGDVDPL